MAASRPHPGPTLLVDVEDFIRYFTFNPRPTGIQRLALEVMRALVEAAPERIRFVRQAEDTLQEVPWSEVAAVADSPAAPDVSPVGQILRIQARRERVKRVIRRLPPDLRDPLFRAMLLQTHVARQVLELLRATRALPPRAIRSGRPGLEGREAAEGVRPGDMLLLLGASWTVPGLGARLASLKRRHGLRIGLLVYDLIPVRRPEWHKPEIVAGFGAWLEGVLPQADALWAISAHTARDLEAFAGERGIKLAGPVRLLPIGTASTFAAAPRPPGLPAPGRYVLFVSTLEARKNHALAVTVWRKLMDEVREGRRAAASVPQLVFAGRVGHGVADLMQQLDNMSWLGGRIRLVRNPSDAELRALYEGALFTLFPSLYEGWGLPVSESLAMGVPCLASDAAAVPEAGGALCRYFDPENVGAAHRAVAALLDDPSSVASWRERVAADFRPVPWSDAATAILSAPELAAS